MESTFNINVSTETQITRPQPRLSSIASSSSSGDKDKLTQVYSEISSRFSAEDTNNSRIRIALITLMLANRL